VLKQKESNVQIRDSDETLSDATISEVSIMSTVTGDLSGSMVALG